MTIFENLTQIARDCEEQGYDSFWIMDHLIQIGLVGKSEDPILESYTALAALGTVTKRIKLGALCTCNFFRNPALLAKMGATVDEISKGRFWLGLGAGWFEEEARMYGYRFAQNKERLDMLEEALQIVKKAWTEKRPSFKGKYYSIDNLILSPKPVQRPRPPILVGGGGEKITLKLVAKYADACNLFPKGEELSRKLDALKVHCKAAKRSYSSILKTKLASVMFARSKEDALKKMDFHRPPWISLEEYSNSFLYGTAADIKREVEELEELGIDYLIINFRGKYDAIDKARFSKEVMTSW
jgi:F420-dependent oxidoreductase-like protein